MWGLLAKGKEFAESIDKQLNESVGVDGKPIASTDEDGLNDAWNDDFEEDDDFDAKIAEHPGSSPPIVAEDDMTEEINFMKSTGTVDNPVSSVISVDSPAAPESKESELVQNLNDIPPVVEEQKEPVEIIQDQTTDASMSSTPRGDILNQVTSVSINGYTKESDDDQKQEVDDRGKCDPEPSTSSMSAFGDLLDKATKSAKATITDSIKSEAESTPMTQFSDMLNQATKAAKAAITDSNDNETERNNDAQKNSDPAKSESEIVDNLLTSERQSTVEEDSPIIVEEQDAGWENDMYDEDDDDDDDEDEDDEEEEENDRPSESIPVVSSKGPIPTSTTTETPPSTITIPSTDAAATEESFRRQQKSHADAIATLNSQLKQLQSQLQQRESEVNQKAQQIATMQAMHESEKNELQSKIVQTKEEAKRRIQKAKERVESMEASMAGKEDLATKDETIAALREEGQKLALKQSEMSQAVRAAKGETRELKSLLEDETSSKEKALEKINNLEQDLKKMKEDLASARKGEAKAVKLENELASLKEEADRKENTNMSLQQNIKELKAENKELVKDLESTQKGAMLESKRESNKLKKEHGDMVSEMEVKLRTLEKDASVREDSLRQEVDELRRRWQDAVRRADALSMDVQNSTAPLLRQLESIDRQNRARAAAWAELETKLRSDLEENIIENEKLTKERNDFKSNLNRTTRISKERNEELSTCKNLIEDQKSKIEKQEAQIMEMETESRKREEEYTEVQRLANEGVSKVRSDMMKTVLESEERCQTQLKSMESELTEERNKRTLLERQVEEMLESAGMDVVPVVSSTPVIKSSREKKLRSVEGQADILAGAISGLDEDSEAEDEVIAVNSEDEAQGALSSFAAMEQLSQRLKESKVELEAIRTSLASSESVRASLLEELSETRVAKEKLPLFQAKVQELADANQQKDIEIMTLTEDIAEIRQLYRAQLNTLLEEKAANLSEVSERVRLSEKPMNQVEENPKEQQNSISSGDLTSQTPMIGDDKSKSTISKQD